MRKTYCNFLLVATFVRHRKVACGYFILKSHALNTAHKIKCCCQAVLRLKYKNVFLKHSKHNSASYNPQKPQQQQSSSLKSHWEE